MKRTGLLSARILIIIAIVALTCGTVLGEENRERSHAQSIQRLLDYMDIQNVMAKHSYYYGAQEQWKELDEAWSKKRDDISYGHNDGYYVGRKSVEAYYGRTNETRRKQTLETVSRIYPEIKNVEENEGVGDLVIHTLTTPYIEIAEDGQTAKGVWMSIGLCSRTGQDGKASAMWLWEKFATDFVKEDGEWKIYRFDMHGTFNTPFDGPGWSEEPYLIGFANMDVDNSDPRWAPNAVINRDENGNPLYVTLRTDTPYCDIHNFQPEFIKPYDTWDEGWDELYSGRKFKPDGPEAMSELKTDPKATYLKEPFRTPAKQEEYPELWVIHG